MKLGFVDKIGSIGSLVTAMACPVCFPMLAVVGSALGLGVLHPFEGKILLAFELLVGVSLIGSFIAYFNHRKILPLLIGVISPGLIFFALYIRFHSVIIYLGLLGLAVASVMNMVANRRCRKCNLEVKSDEA